ncbi:MAG: LuxR C-terminal-related transcriptional regulator [Bacteroidota bacterium]
MHIYIYSSNKHLQEHVQTLILDYLKGNHPIIDPDFSGKIELIIVDIDSVLPEAVRIFQSAKIVLFSSKISPQLLSYTIPFDVYGVLSFDMKPSEWKDTLLAAVDGKLSYTDAVVAMLFSNKMNELSESVQSLTTREMEVIRKMLADYNNEEIAKQLGLSVRTVNAHKGNIMKKIGASTTSGLIAKIYNYAPARRILL